MFGWYAKLGLGIALVGHSVIGHFGYTAFMLQPPPAIALSLILFGGLLNLYHYLLIRRDNPDISQPIKLITTGGLYSRCRHPMYLGDLVWCLGISLYPLSLVSLLLYIIMIPAILFLSKQEDNALALRFPQEFRTWINHTGRLVPAFGAGG